MDGEGGWIRRWTDGRGGWMDGEDGWRRRWMEEQPRWFRKNLQVMNDKAGDVLQKSEEKLKKREF